MANSLSFDNSEYIDMALENSYDMNAVCQQNDSVYRIPQSLLSLPQYCQPYLDHSYATLAASPSASAVDVSQVPVMAEPMETLAAYIDIEDVSCNTTVVTAPMDPDASDDSNEGDPWEGSVTRCICDFQHDDGYMICCDRCGVWQHVDCMGVDRNNIPENYLCELCHPRSIDKRRAIRLQAIKKEQMESEISATDSSSDDQVGGGGGGRRGSGRKRREPTRRRPLDGGPSLTQPNRPPAKRRTTSELGDDKPNGRKNRQLTNIKTPGSRGARRPSTGESSTSRTRRNSAFDAQHHVTIDHSVEDVCQNSYTNGVLMLLASVKEREVAAGKVATSTPINPSLLKEQISQPRIRLAHFGPEAKGIAATETIRVNQAVAEYTGRVMMADEYELDNQLNMFMPFVLRYADAQGVNVCIDSSISGNDARYVRCSCMPNAKVVHVIEQSTIRFFLCATKNITEGREVTIPFYFDYQKCNSEVLCACHRASCQVARCFKQKSSSRPVRVRRNAAFAVAEAKPRASASAEALDNGRGGAATPSGVRQNNRRSAAGSDIRKTTPLMSADVGSDITLMNALTAISSTTVVLGGSAPRSMICSTEGQQPNGGGHASSPLATSEGRPESSAAAAATRSAVTPLKEAAKAERGRRAAGVGRNRSQPPQPETTLEASSVGRVGTVRSNRLRDKAQQQQQQIASLPSHKD